ncbi:MAG: saccharopine dehydrogenase NADP-binding domain-containing protein [candidate division KSB1 bacterium]|nr:saccharopine dehydrogenase NADP-binding domain-containing protein [candidate division KSB1 bacterium]MDZ7376970.1 saccharopine dehydrogenase NADP-binding domain-containing protein [candidate division KSB1 bacterium]
MKVLVFGGSGKIGSAVAWDLAKDKDIRAIGITGRRIEALEQTKAWIGGEKIVPHVLDVADKESAIKLMKQYDAGAIALPDRRTSYKIVHYAVEAGLNIVDMLEEYHRRPDAYETEGLELPPGMTLNQYGDWLHETAITNGVTFVDGMGFAPGLSNVTVGEAIRKMDVAETAIARVGGIPSKESAQRHPLKYMITWAFEHVLREYMIKLNVIKDGKVMEVPAIGDRERFRFTKFGQDEELVCAVTPGMPSFIFTRPGLKEFAEKTIRWPGHWEAIDTLKECGLLDLDPHDFKGVKIVPREFLLSLITPRLRAQQGDTDVCVMYNTVTGVKDGKKIKIEYFMWDEADVAHGISSMMRATGFPVAITVKLLLEGLIKEKGIVPPEDCIKGPLYQRFMEELKKRDIAILEETSIMS